MVKEFDRNDQKSTEKDVDMINFVTDNQVKVKTHSSLLQAKTIPQTTRM